jgi:hypothetical protein
MAPDPREPTSDSGGLSHDRDRAIEELEDFRKALMSAAESYESVLFDLDDSAVQLETDFDAIRADVDTLEEATAGLLMTDDPDGGGHAPGHLRAAFTDWVEQRTVAPEDDDLQTAYIDNEPRSIRWLIGMLWNCTDTLPSGYCDDLDLPRGSTYAQAVRDVTHDPAVQRGKDE